MSLKYPRLDTAFIENMDYHVTADKKMNVRQLRQLKEVRIYSQKHPELKIELIERKEDLIDFLNQLFPSKHT
jgi:hypothetical protein